MLSLSSQFARRALCMLAFALLLLSMSYSFSDVPVARAAPQPAQPGDIVLDSRLPVQTVRANSSFFNVNAKFGSRFNFTISPGVPAVSSGTSGTFHDSAAGYSVGVTPAGQHTNFLFHLGPLDSGQGDTYLSNERWIQGLDTTRWIGEALNGKLRIFADIIDTFRGEPGCTDVALCMNDVKDDIVPVFIVGLSVQNLSDQAQTGNYFFGSNSNFINNEACSQYRTPAGTSMTTFSYDTNNDSTDGNLFLAGTQASWQCQQNNQARSGLSWKYQVAAAQTQTVYLLLGAWNANQRVLVNTKLPAGCQDESLYSARLWSGQNDVIGFAMDNLTRGDNLLARAQSMENYLLNNSVLTPEQRWLIGDTLRSYKAASWLTARKACAGGGLDAAVYEGTYGFLSTIDVMHEYGYFEINRVPWFFKAAMSMVFQNATSNTYGTYFQHDQGGNVDKHGNCTVPGAGIPTFRSTCYTPPYVMTGVPMPTEENDNVALLMAYYISVTGDMTFVQRHIAVLDAAMEHNVRVGSPITGIAEHDTTTTYDAANDCLHNAVPGARDLYYQGLKEAAGYRATAYLDSLLTNDTKASAWRTAAATIEAAMLARYNSNGFIPLADNSASNNCSARSIALGDGLFYLHLIGQDRYMSQPLLNALARQYPEDLQDSRLDKDAMIALASKAATGPDCRYGYCTPYTWFSKVMLSGFVADFIYTRYGCTACKHPEVVKAAYDRNINNPGNFADGMREDGKDWDGHVYPRGIISWAFLDRRY
ncbi:hypothetical protein EPA93_32780 [Ktedonosporobacter rubrisoli]|uniref:Uncharacterized protein n=1 Tax=Ktedonosporobacter rubrisoli TaxID=2509675 RepID=A0A4P6JXV1_KTERU|nr:glycoside hydrolase family 52 protein [Ktedonosporobacter rubrisoli]QBD80494.1 hypothetical protein EPA93_32780 [Ktedonosporobacter rubrisoli]